MSSRTPVFPRALRWGAVACLVLVLAGCGHEYPQSALSPKGDFARMIDELFDTVMLWATLVFVLVEGALIWAIFKFRGRPNDAEPAQVHGNTTLEIVWTLIPALILAMIAVPTVRAIFKNNEIPTDNPLEVRVVGHQWWWEFEYPEFGLTTANELHVPVGRTVSLRMGTSDVLHSFWTPQLAGKRDVFPNRETRLWFKAEEAGFYPGQCAEFCGIQHGKMAFTIVAEEPAEFERYVGALRSASATGPAAAAAPTTTTQGATVAVAAQGSQQGNQPGGAPPQARTDSATPDTTRAAPPSDVIAAGQKAFQARGCIGCHSLSAANAPKGMIGPNLALVGSRRYIAAGTLKNTDENLAHWIRDPQSVKEGVKMPNLGVTEAEAQALVAYFRALAK